MKLTAHGKMERRSLPGRYVAEVRRATMPPVGLAMRIIVTLGLLIILTTLSCDSRQDDQGRWETAITVTGLVRDGSNQAAVESVLVEHQFPGVADSSWEVFNDCLTDEMGLYETGEPQTDKPHGRFVFTKRGYEDAILDAAMAERVAPSTFRLDAMIWRRGDR